MVFKHFYRHLNITNGYLFFSASMGKMIVNLQRDARKEFKGSTARRTPHACIAIEQTIINL